MEDDGLGDWRLAAVTTLAADVPATPQGAPAHKAGARVALSTAARNPRGQLIGFTAPSAVAMALNIAMRTELQARELHDKIRFVDTVTPWGSGRGLHADDEAILFDYFEQCMIVAVFSFQALESYCNQTIADKLKGTFPIERGRRRNAKVIPMTATEIERQVSTEEKLGVVLPGVLKIASPRGKKVWQNFVTLKGARDSTIHLKALDQYRRVERVEDLDIGSLFDRFLHDDLSAIPKSAVAMIYYFARVTDVPRWMKHPLAVYGLG